MQLLAIALCWLSTLSLARQTSEISWSPAVRISNDSAISNLPRTIVQGDTIHLFWFGIDEFLTLSQDGIQYSRSTDAGGTFTTPVTLFPFDAALSPPQSAGSGQVLYAAIGAFIDASYGAVLLRSTDGGSTWEAPRLIRSSVFPRLIAAADSVVYIHFTDPVTRINGMLASSDYGETWNVANASMPELTDMLINRKTIHAVGPAASRILQEIGYYTSPNGGTNWIGPDILSSEDVTKSERPSIAANELGNFFVVWSDTGKVMTRSSRNSGITWTPQQELSGEIGTVTTDIAAAREFVGVVWDKDVGGTSGVRIRTSNDFAATYFPAGSPAESAAASEPSLLFTGNTIHLVWHEHVGGAPEIYYRQGTVEDNPTLVTRPPRDYALKQNYPNPFNGTSRIEYELPRTGYVSLVVYTLLGSRVAVMQEGELPQGRYSVTFEAGGLPSGIYIYVLRTGDFTEIRKLTVLR